MLDLEKILVKIVLLLVTALFIVLLFNSCKTHKQTIKTAIDSTATEAVKVESNTTDNSKTQEDYTEITYILDTTSIINFEGGKLNYSDSKIKVSQIKVKKSHVTKENDINNEIYATEQKMSEIKEKSTTFAKTKPNTTRNLRLVAVLFISIVVLLALWRFYKKLN